jgi:hypothetical protein
MVSDSGWFMDVGVVVVLTDWAWSVVEGSGDESVVSGIDTSGDNFTGSGGEGA